MRALTLLCALAAAAAQAGVITLDGTAQAHRYDGHGGLSAGASSRLLWDYPEPYRSDILDWLFKPSFGMALHTLKVEIGGDTQSTDGTEPSHMHTRDDLSCDRGYEIWLIQQARARNPAIQTYQLSWGVPSWVGGGDYYSADNWMYQTLHAECIRNKTGMDVTFAGDWNERSWGTMDYVVGLRNTLNAAGFTGTRIVLPDGGYDGTLLTDSLANATFNASWDIMGLHYPCPDDKPDPFPLPTPQQVGKGFWASEQWWQNPDWDGAAAWGRLLNQQYVLANMTAVISWSPLWSVYTNLPFQEAGLMRARTPWSGAYDVSPPIWTSAQWMQFTQPGWWYLSRASGSSGFLPGGGSYVSLVDPASPATGFTLILETFVSGARCPTPHPATAPQTVTFRTTGGLPGAGAALAAWQTNASDYFLQLPDVVIGSDGSFTVTIGVDTMLTLSTVRTAAKGSPPHPIPAWQRFPLPYADDFSGYPYDGIGRYWADQFGSFAVRNGSMQQVGVGNPGTDAWVTDWDPLTIIGDVNWTDITVNMSATWQPAPGNVHRASLHTGDGAAATLAACDASSPFQVWQWNVTGPNYLSNNPAPHGLPGPAYSRKARLHQRLNGGSATAAQAAGAQAEGNAKGKMMGHAHAHIQGKARDSVTQCLNVYGCEDQLVYWSCVTTGGTCCGGDCYQNLQWQLSAGALTSFLDSGTKCATGPASGPANGTTGLTLAACGSPLPATQTWSYDSSSGQLRHGATGLCLEQVPPPPPRAYVQICARLGQSSWAEKADAPNGYCLQVGDPLTGPSGNGSSVWVVTAGPGVALGSGPLPATFAPADWHTLSLSVRGSGAGVLVSAVVDGAVVTPGGLSDPSGTYITGMVAAGSGYHTASFDDFSVTPA